MSNIKIFILRLNDFILFNRKNSIILIYVVVFLFIYNATIYAQPENPPFPISVNTIQNLAFGAFAQGASGGTVTIDTYGVRLSTGDVVLLNLGFIYFPAIISVVANPGTVIQITLDPNPTLSYNGYTMSLHLEGVYPNPPFVTTEATTQVYIGGILTVGNPLANPPGNYSGTFSIIFNQE